MVQSRVTHWAARLWRKPLQVLDLETIRKHPSTPRKHLKNNGLGPFSDSFLAPTACDQSVTQGPGGFEPGLFPKNRLPELKKYKVVVRGVPSHNQSFHGTVGHIWNVAKG